jgi:hypothetical protein
MTSSFFSPKPDRLALPPRDTGWSGGATPYLGRWWDAEDTHEVPAREATCEVVSQEQGHDRQAGYAKWVWGGAATRQEEHQGHAHHEEDDHQEDSLMTARECSVEEFVRGLGPSQQMEVQANLDQGKGMALYRDAGGRAVVAVSYGPRGADIVGLPPKVYGGGELDLFVSPRPAPASMRSPLLDYEPPPQVARPRVAPTSTAYPEVLISGGRTSSHPRGNAEFITPLLPGRPQEEVPQAPLNESAQWLADRLGR